MAIKLLALLFCVTTSLQASRFVIQDLGPLPDELFYANAFNNRDVVAGNHVLEDGTSMTTDFILDKKTGLTRLPHVATYQSPLINNQNTVVGLYWHKTNHWFENTQSKHIYFRYSDGFFRDIGAPDKWIIQSLSTISRPNFLHDNRELGLVSFNDRGQILVSNASNSFIRKAATRFAVWQDGQFIYLDENALSFAFGMNNEGLILGTKNIGVDQRKVSMLVLYDFERDTTIEIMEDINLWNTKLNDRGEVLFIQATKNELKGYLWNQENGLVPLNGFLPIAMNNHHQMIGVKNFLERKSVSYLWDQGEMINLQDDLKSDANNQLWSDIIFHNINDRGHILGEGTYDGKKHLLILIPKGE